jgi:hypothetical protein
LEKLKTATKAAVCAHLSYEIFYEKKLSVGRQGSDFAVTLQTSLARFAEWTETDFSLPTVEAKQRHQRRRRPSGSSNKKLHHRSLSRSSINQVNLKKSRKSGANVRFY